MKLKKNGHVNIIIETKKFVRKKEWRDIMRTKKFDEIKPYTYYIKRKSDGLQYHGVRVHNVKLNRTPLEDFSIYYFSSGKFKNEFKENPENFTWKISWTFDSIEEALSYETKINNKIYKRKSWINSHGKYIPIESSKIGREKTFLMKYGVYHNSKIPNVVNKRKNTFLLKYGVDNPSKSELIKNKVKNTLMKKYGVKSVFEMIDLKKSYMDKLGVDSPLKCKKVKEKMINTNMTRYGVKYTVQSKEVIDKIHKKRREMYIKLAKMTNLEFNNYLKSISSHPAVQAQKKTQRLKGLELLRNEQNFDIYKL